VLVDGNGIPVNLLLTAGQKHESQYVEPVLDGVSIRGKRGHPLKRSRHVVGDKAYSSEAVRTAISARGSVAIIPRRSNQKQEYYFDKELYRGRNVVERSIGWLKERRSLGTRYCKLAVNFLAMLMIGCIQQYLKILEPLI
jgi:transposase